MFIGDTLQVEKFIAQINQFSTCSTPNCIGNYKLRDITLGGAVIMSYNCSECDNRPATFESTGIALSGEPIIMKAMQVASICAGLTYAQYRKFLENSFGIHTASSATFSKTLKEMYPVVKSMLDDICNEAKTEMKGVDTSELGSWGNAVTTGDAMWLTRGFHSCNGTYTVRNFLTGALLYYEHMCQQKLDNVSEGEAYPGT